MYGLCLSEQEPQENRAKDCVWRDPARGVIKPEEGVREKGDCEEGYRD